MVRHIDVRILCVCCCVCLCVLCCAALLSGVRALQSTWICVFNRKGNKCLYTYADKISPCTKRVAALPKLIAAWIPFLPLVHLHESWHHEFDQDENGIIKRALVLLPNAPETTTTTIPTINSNGTNKDETKRTRKSEEWKRRRVKYAKSSIASASVNKSVIWRMKGKWKREKERIRGIGLSE